MTGAFSGAASPSAFIICRMTTPGSRNACGEADVCEALSGSAEAAAAGDPSGGVAATSECVTDGVHGVASLQGFKIPRARQLRGSTTTLIQGFNIIRDNPRRKETEPK